MVERVFYFINSKLAFEDSRRRLRGGGVSIIKKI